MRTLSEHDVRYVMIGAVAARLAGYPLATYDSDITPERETANLERLAAALRALDAKVFTASVPEGLVFDCSAQMLARADVWNLVTAAGRLDILFAPAGVSGYDELARDADHYDVDGIDVPAASLQSIVRMKEAADRPKDQQAVAIIRAMLERDKRRA
ncbi:MAG: hypothetical protein WD771_08680 [Gemmatimonadaceae bacterium]